MAGNVIIGSDHVSTIEISDGGGLSGLTRWLRAQADGITLSQADSSRLITPADGGGAVMLPAAPLAGTEYEFATLSGDSPLTISAQGLHVIMLDGLSGTTIVGSTGGLRLSLVYAGANTWIGLASGSWGLS